MTRHKKIVMALLAFVVFFRPGGAMRANGLDASCYLQWLFTFLSTSFGSCPVNDFSPGPALLWLPAGLIGRGIGGLLGGATDSWISAAIGAESFLLFFVSLMIWRKLNLDEWLFFTMPVLYYFLMQTHWSHSGEIFLMITCVFLLWHKDFWWSLFAAVCLFAVRFSDFPMLLIVLCEAARSNNFSTNEKRTFWICSSVIAMFVCWILFGLGWGVGYHDTNATLVISTVTWERAFTVLFGSDFGVLWVFPVWLVIFFWGGKNLMSISITSRIAFIWMAFSLVVCIGWKGNGGDFTYRYLLGSFAAMIWILLAERPHFVLAKWFQWLTKASVIWMVYLTWIYRTFDFFPREITSGFSRTVSSFQWRALQVLIQDPFQVIHAVRYSAGWIASCVFFRDARICEHSSQLRGNGVSKEALLTVAFVLSVLLVALAISCFSFRKESRARRVIA